jgi:23S rRNA-/tRNA-specific pseudouridylate synthase
MIPIHEDEHLLVLEKPSGLLSVPGRGPEKQDCLSKRVQDRYPEALIVHRLDQDTSGLLLMARGIEAQRRLSKLFETRQVKKRYVAVVTGNPKRPWRLTKTVGAPSTARSCSTGNAARCTSSTLMAKPAAAVGACCKAATATVSAPA